jgi:periplasmic protein CpxP/Spy
MTGFRLIALAPLLGAAMLFAPPLSAQKASDGGGKPPAAQAATSTRPDTVEQRITALKAALKITPEQESQWNGVAQAMRDNASMMDKLIRERREKTEKMNAVEDLRTYQEIAQARLDALKNLTSAFESLYDAMTSEQKANADNAFSSQDPHRQRGGKQG